MSELTIGIKGCKDLDAKVMIAKTVLNPCFQNGITQSAFNKSVANLDPSELIAQLREQCTADNFNAEQMLMAQAVTLDAIFNNLACRAASNFGEYLPAADTYMKLALRAQNQSGKTLQVILQNQQNKLLNEAKPNDGVDTIKTIEAIEGNKTVATLVKFNGSKISKRQKESVTKCL
jgi:hypothetical protein